MRLIVLALCGSLLGTLTLAAGTATNARWQTVAYSEEEEWASVPTSVTAVTSDGGEIVISVDGRMRSTKTGYVAPHRVEQNLTDRQRRVLHILSKGGRLAASAIRAELDANLAERTLRDDLQMLRELHLIDTAGRGPGARWWLV